MGIQEPKATFSACYGAPFMVWNPHVYAALLAEKIQTFGCQVWLINTGWTGDSLGQGHQRIALAHTRAILEAIHNGSLAKGPFERVEAFSLLIPKHVEGVPSRILNPRNTWQDPAQYDKTYHKLKVLFEENDAKHRR